ncbi:MAG: TIGR03557 family F420-dependent LLM class oxidoreductase [Dehalococcoidia bacterium]
MSQQSHRPFIGIHAAGEQFAPGEIVDIAVAAETAGFDGLSVSDHFLPWQDNQGHATHAWLALAAAGQRTERLHLTTSITCPTYRVHPAQVAHGFASLGALYPGRVALGVGTGEALNEASAGGGWGPYRERAKRLIEAIRLIRRLWTGDWVDFEGRYFRVRNARIYDLPGEAVPIYIAASGPRSARIAGAEGEGWITDAVTHGRPDVLQAFEAGASDAGKDSSALERIVELYVVVGDQEEALAGARLWRFLPIFGEIIGNSDPREIQRIAEERTPLERVIQSWLVSADPQKHITAIAEVARLGATRVYIHSPQSDQRRVIEFYGREVLPAFR